MRRAVRIAIGAVAALALAAGSGDGDSRVQSPASKAKGAAKAKPADLEPAGPRFAHDVVPVLIANCVECHNADRMRGKLDMTTFAKLMAGSESGRVIEPGKPEESSLVLHIKGEEDPKMPPGDRTLAASAISIIEAWVKAGAQLDSGLSPTAELAKIAPSADQVRLEALAKLSPQERDKRLVDVALGRWKQANAKSTPDATSGPHFALFGTLAKERAEQTLKVLETQPARLRPIVGNAPGEGPEKVSVYVFDDLAAYVELTRSLEKRDVDPAERAHARFDLPDPFIVAIDPGTGGDRSLAGILAEQYAAGALAKAGKTPRWLSLGLGAYFAAQIEPKSPYYRLLRAGASRQVQLGWEYRATQALGGESDDDTARAVGFSLVEYLATAWRPRLLPFVKALVANPKAFDDAIQSLWGADRRTFLGLWGTWVGSSYARR